MAGCGCGGGSGGFADGLVAADQLPPDENYFWNGSNEPTPDDAPPVAEGAKRWDPETGTTEG